MAHDYRKNQAIALEYARSIECENVTEDKGKSSSPITEPVSVRPPIKNSVSVPRPIKKLAYVPPPITEPVSVTRTVTWLAPDSAPGPPRLPHLSRHAPSQWERHPYAKMRLKDLGSGHRIAPPHPSQCPECKMDAFVEDCRRVCSSSAASVTPDNEYKGPKLGYKCWIDFKAVDEKPLFQQGILVDDILMFNTNMVDAGQLVVRHSPGPIKVVLEIQKVGKTHDIIYANCGHRPITRFNLAWILALSFRRLAEDKFKRSVKDLRLVGLYSNDSETNWVAIARYKDAPRRPYAGPNFPLLPRSYNGILVSQPRS
ncbi:hypothetical protein DFH06DRAFT_1305256 [Mycena polygramma]|nr:hypothetical protein DFH06DRAFT_1305256 [Mycena polygramma]